MMQHDSANRTGRVNFKQHERKRAQRSRSESLVEAAHPEPLVLSPLGGSSPWTELGRFSQLRKQKASPRFKDLGAVNESLAAA